MASFEFEIEMAKPVENWLRSQGLEVKSEFRLPWGMCDLMAASFVKRHVRTRIKQGQDFAIGSLLRAQLLLQIPDQEKMRGVTLAALCKRYNSLVDDEHIKDELRILVNRKFVQVSDRGSFKKVNGWMPLHKRLVAVELKLSRIGEALHQAIRNRPAAGESYVALPKTTAYRIQSSPRISEFEKTGIGLISVSKSGCDVLLKAATRKSRINDAVQLLCADRFLRDHVKGIVA